MTPGQHIALRRVLHVLHCAICACQAQAPRLFPVLKERAPVLGDFKPGTRFCELVDLPSDDLISRKTQQLRCSATGIAATPFIVGDQNGFGRGINNRSEQQLNLPESLVEQPMAGLRKA